MGAATKHFGHVIVGGGVTGASIAYHLAKGLTASNAPTRLGAGTRNSICILERATLGSGQTSRSAGIVLHQHKNPAGVELARQTSEDIFRDLRENTDDLILEQPGSLNAVTGAACAEDYFVDPHSLAASYLRRAKDLIHSAANSTSADSSAANSEPSLAVRENTEVTSCGRVGEGDSVQLQIAQTGETDSRDGVQSTDATLISADRVYLATGIWSDQFLSPTYWANIRSHYWEFSVDRAAATAVSRRYPDAATRIPIYLAPGLYIKMSANRQKVEIGIQERESCVVESSHIVGNSGTSLGLDDEGAFGPTDLLLEKQDVIDEYLGAGFLDHAEMRDYISGLSTYTADGLPVLNSAAAHESGAPVILGCGGCNGYGITWAGGLGKLVADVGMGHALDSDLLAQLDASRFVCMQQGEIVDRAVAQRANKFRKAKA